MILVKKKNQLQLKKNYLPQQVFQEKIMMNLKNKVKKINQKKIKKLINSNNNNKIWN